MNPKEFDLLQQRDRVLRGFAELQEADRHRRLRRLHLILGFLAGLAAPHILNAIMERIA